MSVIAWMMIFAALFEIPTGIYSDMIGRKNTMIASAVTGILSAVSLAVGTAYIFLFSSSLFAGLSRAFQEGNNEAYIYETLHGEGKEHLYHHYLGKLSSVFQFALIFAAIGGSILASKSFTLLIWIAILPKVCMLIISFFLPNRHFIVTSQRIFLLILATHFGRFIATGNSPTWGLRCQYNSLSVNLHTHSVRYSCRHYGRYGLWAYRMRCPISVRA